MSGSQPSNYRDLDTQVNSNVKLIEGAMVLKNIQKARKVVIYIIQYQDKKFSRKPEASPPTNVIHFILSDQDESRLDP